MKTSDTTRILDTPRSLLERLRESDATDDWDMLVAIEDRMLDDNWETEHDRHVLDPLIRLAQNDGRDHSYCAESS